MAPRNAAPAANAINPLLSNDSGPPVLVLFLMVIPPLQPYRTRWTRHVASRISIGQDGPFRTILAPASDHSYAFFSARVLIHIKRTEESIIDCTHHRCLLTEDAR